MLSVSTSLAHAIRVALGDPPPPPRAPPSHLRKRSQCLTCDMQRLAADAAPADVLPLSSLTDPSPADAILQQMSAPGNSGSFRSQAMVPVIDGLTGAWSALQKRVSSRGQGRERSSPAQFRRHGPFQKAVLPPVLWTLDPADDGGELVAGVEAEAINAARAVAAAARALATRAFGIEL